jgi:hypothetical protein
MSAFSLLIDLVHPNVRLQGQSGLSGTPLSMSANSQKQTWPVKHNTAPDGQRSGS